MTRLEQIGGEAFRALVGRTGGTVAYRGGQYWLEGPWSCYCPLTNHRGGSAGAQLALATRCVERVVAARARGESVAARIARLVSGLRKIDPRQMGRGPGQPFGAFGELQLDTLDAAVASLFGTARVTLALWTGEKVEVEAPTLAAAIDAAEARAREVLQLGPQLRVIQGGATEGPQP